MDKTRRSFIQLAGITALAASGSKALAADQPPETLPPENPLTGNRWAMVIDLKKCQKQNGCTACSDACHYVHNVPDIPIERQEVKWIWKEDFKAAFPNQEHEYLQRDLPEKDVLVFCNQCENPPCVRVCPTKATWKREDGIVMMDMHRCIGCRYCVVACPYGSRSFNWGDPHDHIRKINPHYPTRKKGVVEKCTFCEERLAKGLLPACVEACPVKAMTFGDLSDDNSEVRRLLRERYTIRRKPGLGTNPNIYYIV